jgi:transcription elongation factor Elf1
MAFTSCGGENGLSRHHAVARLEHVHKCPRCESVVRASEIDHSAIATGVITCLKCEFSGPINVQIVPEEP